MIKAIVFDVGETLITYNRPLNWTRLYRSALEEVNSLCGFNLNDTDYDCAIDILKKYNTRINPRECEISSDVIFTEILNVLEKNLSDLQKAKRIFYSYFRSDVSLFDDTEEILKFIKTRGIKIATLSDVPYGMDNEYVLKDIEQIIQYIDLPFTSNDSGYRKPNKKGLCLIAEKFGIRTNEMIYVGDEEKDILCAKNAGVFSVLIDRKNEGANFNQYRTIKSLMELSIMI